MGVYRWLFGWVDRCGERFLRDANGARGRKDSEESTPLRSTTLYNIDGSTTELPKGMDVIDTLTPEYRQMQEDAMSGKSLGMEVDRLVQELITIGRSTGFEVGRDRTREIGMRINEIGGFELMQAAALKALAVIGPQHERDLEWEWDGIGEWQK